jgi:addiction module RelB/DinJ family antitoxin
MYIGGHFYDVPTKINHVAVFDNGHFSAVDTSWFSFPGYAVYSMKVYNNAFMNQAIQVRIDAKLKKQADNVLDDIGLDMPTAIRLFLRKVVVSRSIPFELKSRITVNGFTEEFEDEVLKAAEEKDFIGPFYNAEDAIKALRKNVK